jgi:hypothetical protein
MAKWPPPVYRVELEFDVPRDFAFAWATDYRPDDATRSKERFERRILKRGRSRIEFEDSGWTEDGWIWRRSHVTLHPPGRWHADTFGSFRDGVIDYTVDPLPGERCRFTVTFHRRPSAVHPTQPTKAALEAELTRMWTNYGRAMVRDYRTARRGPRGRRPRAA